MVLWQEGKTPELGAGRLAPPLEKDGVVHLVEDSDLVSVKEDSAAVVTELADAKEVVLEGRHDVALGNW
jgi:hypothetical protein